MKKIPTEDGVGKVLAYDTTLVTLRESSTLLERGHVITEADVAKLKDSGVYRVWIESKKDNLVYEWEISSEIGVALSDGTTELVQGNHGIVFLTSKVPGILKIDRKKLTDFNINQSVLFISKNENLAVGKGEIVGAIDVVPLAISKGEMKKVVKLASKGMVSVKPFKLSKVGLVITGTEVYEKRKKDEYFRIVKRKCDKYGWKIVYKEIVPDDSEKEIQAIMKARESGAEAIIVTGGMSVDPTDQTPGAIRKLGARVLSYGIPIKPTTMTILSIWKGLPLFGISAGGIRYREFNSIDVMFTRMMAGEIPTKREIAGLGYGGIFWNYNTSNRGTNLKNSGNVRTH